MLALEGAGRGVTSNTVCPGYVRTPLVEGQIADQAREHGISMDRVVDEVLLARSSVKRLVEPDEVAQLVALLCGPGTASVTGSSYLMDGGWTAACPPEPRISARPRTDEDRRSPVSTTQSPEVTRRGGHRWAKVVFASLVGTATER